MRPREVLVSDPGPREPLVSRFVLPPPKKTGPPGSAGVRGQGSNYSPSSGCWEGSWESDSGLPVTPGVDELTHLLQSHAAVREPLLCRPAGRRRCGRDVTGLPPTAGERGFQAWETNSLAETCYQTALRVTWTRRRCARTRQGALTPAEPLGAGTVLPRQLWTQQGPNQPLC